MRCGTHRQGDRRDIPLILFQRLSAVFSVRWSIPRQSNKAPLVGSLTAVQRCFCVFTPPFVCDCTPPSPLRLYRTLCDSTPPLHFDPTLLCGCTAPFSLRLRGRSLRPERTNKKERCYSSALSFTSSAHWSSTSFRNLLSPCSSASTASLPSSSTLAFR